MIHETLVFLKNSLNAHLHASGKPHDPKEDQVVFPVGQNTENLTFKLGAISVMMLNIEQEEVLRAPNLYRRTMPDGSVQRVNPEIRLNLYVLFVSYYQQYEDSLRNLSAVIQYFQNHRIFTHEDSPELNEGIEQLMIELITLPFAEHNEVWSSLRVPYRPSVLYKIKTLVFDGDALPTAPLMAEQDIKVLE